LNGHFVCSYIGTIGMACGLGVVLRAARILKDKGRWDINFLLVGDGAMKDKLQHEAKSAGLDSIVFTGRLDKHHMPAYLNASDACLVHLKKQELFKSVLPSKMFEAAAMEKPILLGVEGCAADYLRNANAGIAFEPENAEQLVAAIEKLAADRDLGHRYGSSARAYVLRHFDRDELSRQ
jgi:colanic acid biosynthesis glycosyl transferase WcaI